MVSKKDLEKARKVKVKWEGVEEEYGQLLEQKIRDFMKTENINEEEVQEELKKYRKVSAFFPHPVVIPNIVIGKDFYKQIIIRQAYIYAKEKVPPNCFMFPKQFQTSIIKYNAHNNSALLIVRRREQISKQLRLGDYKITEIEITYDNFTRWMDLGEMSELNHLLKFITYTPMDEILGILKFTFLLEATNIGKLELEGKCTIETNKQREFAIFMKNDKGKFKRGLIKKIRRFCFEKSKEIIEEHGCNFPEVDLILKQLDSKKK